MIAAPASAVSAAPGDGGTGSITVYKYEQPDGDLGPNDGSLLPATDAKPVVAGFTSCAIDGIDLSLSSDWERLKSINLTLAGDGSVIATEEGENLSMTCGTEQTTDAESGATTFAALAADKAYVVYESTVPSNAVSAAQPTLLTVPYPGSTGDPAWNYNPVIYPKNVLAGSGATKNGEIVGNKVTYDITAPINPLPAGETHNEFVITDALSSFLTYTAGSVTLQDAQQAEVVLVEGTDYTLTAPSGNGGEQVVLEMTASGLAILDATIGGQIVLTLDATATATGDTSNTAVMTVNGAAADIELPDPESFYYGAHIVKEAANRGADANVPLGGAQFDVYSVDPAATECVAEPAEDAVPVLAAQESDATGATPSQVLADGKYCVYETLVPAGYKGLQGGVLFEVTAEDASVTIVNTQIGSDAGDLPFLPMTGGAGTMLLLGAGGVMFAIGAILFIVVRRRKQEEGETALIQA